MGSLPLQYLGVPLISKRLTSVDCKGLIDKMVARIKCWTSKLLSYAGRLILIKSVLFSLQVYWSSLFILPKKVLKQMEQIMRAFLWSRPDLKGRGAKVSWVDISLPKNEGGLGIKNLEIWNKVVMSKHIWNLIRLDSSSLWVDWVKLYLIRDHSF